VFGLAAIKNVGMGSTLEIEHEREEHGPYANLWDFCRRVACRGVAKSTVKLLIEAGALEGFGHRAQLLAALDSAYSAGQKCEADRAAGQTSLFGEASEEDLPVERLPDVPPLPDEHVLELEKDLLGIYLSNHPLVRNEERLERCVSASLDSLAEYADGTEVVVGGMVREVKPYTTRNGDKMAFITLESLAGEVEATVFPRVWETVKTAIVKDALVVVDAKIDRQSRRGGGGGGGDEETVKLLCDGARPLDKARRISEKRLELAEEGRRRQAQIAALPPPVEYRPPRVHVEFDALSAGDQTLLRLREFINGHRGAQEVVLHLSDHRNARRVLLGPTYKVRCDGELPAALKSISGCLQVWEEEPELVAAGPE